MAEAGAVASQAEQKIKLKLYYGGSFVKVGSRAVQASQPHAPATWY